MTGEFSPIQNELNVVDEFGIVLAHQFIQLVAVNYISHEKYFDLITPLVLNTMVVDVSRGFNQKQ